MSNMVIRLCRKGCANRPFYYIVIAPAAGRRVDEGIEQLGVYDPMPNENNERLLSLNIDRFKQYVAEGAWVNATTAMLLGAAGVLPLHPHSLTLAWRKRQWKLKKEQSHSEEKAKANS